MTHSLGSQLCRWSAILWLAISTVYLLVVSGLMIGDPHFPLNLGVIRTTGRTGLWLTLLPAMFGLLAMVLVAVRVRAGAVILGLYCGFWTVLLLTGLASVWNAQESFCTQTMCIRTPWIGRLLVFGLMTPFVAVAFWARTEFGRKQANTLPG